MAPLHIGWRPTSLDVEAQLGAAREREAELKNRLECLEDSNQAVSLLAGSCFEWPRSWRRGGIVGFVGGHQCFTHSMLKVVFII